MKLKQWLALSAALILPIAAYASFNTDSNPTPPYLNIDAPNQLDGVNIDPNTAGTGNFTTLTATTLNPTGFTGQGIPFSTSQTGNPLVQLSHTNVTVSTQLTSASMTTIIASAAGRTIYPQGGLTIEVSGTAATATALALECSDGTLIASWPIADLVTLKPIGIGLYLSTLSTITTGAGVGSGCPASTAVMLSNTGTNITTTTQVYLNIPYVVQ